MGDNVDILLRFCEEQWTQGRQSETQRATVTNFVITIAAATLTFIGHKGFESASIPLAVFLVVLGLYGATTSMKLYERWHFHMSRARYWRKKIDELDPDAQLIKLKEQADAKHKSKYPRLGRLPLNWLWLALHISIASLGIVCIIVIVMR